jgi:hypothetical protein
MRAGAALEEDATMDRPDRAGANGERRYTVRLICTEAPLSREDLEALEEEGWHLIDVRIDPDGPGRIVHRFRRFTG